MYNWMDIYLVSGLWNLECGLMLQVLWNRLGIRYNQLHEFVCDFVWPVRFGNEPRDVFEKRSKAKAASGKKHRNISCSASAGLSVYNVVRLFLIMKAQPLANEREDTETITVILSYMMLCTVLDLLNSKHGVDPQRLHCAIKQHLDMFLLAYGEDHWIPKHHMSIHLPSMLFEHGLLISCFVHERKHKEIKRYIPHKMTEKDILLEVTALQWRGLVSSSFAVVATLVNPKVATNTMTKSLQAHFKTRQQIYTAKEAVCASGLRVFHDDVVTLTDSVVAEVLFHFSVDNKCITCVERWTPLKTDINMYSPSSTVEFVDTDDIIHVCTWRSHGSVAYVIPHAGFE